MSQHPYDSERIVDVCARIETAYQESVSSFEQRQLKTDYSLLTLNSCQEFCHIRGEGALDFNQPLPRFWFNPLDFNQSLPCMWFDSSVLSYNVPRKKELREKLALPKATHQALSQVITCAFPAGAMFLRCEVEPQEDQPGGGIEYIYLRNMSQQVREVRTARLV